VLGDSLRGCLDFLLPADRVYVVPNCVLGEEALRALRGQRRQSRERGLAFLHLSNLQRSKGTWCVMEAFARIAGSHPDCTLVLAGPWRDVDEEREARAFIVEAGIEDRVTVTGQVDGSRKLKVFEDADVFVMPVRYAYEGQPVVILEAMASGMPVVASEQAVIADTVQPIAGLCVKADPQSVAVAMERLMEDEALRARLASGAAETYDARFSFAAFEARLRHAIRSGCQD